MKHHAIEQLQTVAKIDQDYPRAATRIERLERWAELLERNPTRALATLEGWVRERQWEADWEESRHHREQAERLLRGGDLTGSFREFCRAMLPLTEAVQKYRQKGEGFKPLWGE